MGMRSCTIGLKVGAYDVDVGDVLDSTHAAVVNHPAHFSATDAELDAIIAGAPSSAYTQTYSTAARTVPNATYAAPAVTVAAHTYPASGNLFDAVAADLLINVRDDSTANAVADVVVNEKSLAANLNQLITDLAATNTALAALAADVLALKKLHNAQIDDLQAMGLFA